MSKFARLKSNSVVVLLFLFANVLLADPVQCPYFVVKPVAGDVKVSLPLIHTEANVNIAGVIADVKVKQVYVNEGSVALEAIYVFPGSSNSAVYGMQMTIGDRVTKAVIQEKEEARANYEKAKTQGKSASLLEQHRPNVFQMNVANIQPGDKIIVELSYTELITPENGVYEFVYPTIVGPRYSSPDDLENNAWINNTHTHKDTYKTASKTHTFDINVHVEAGMEIANIESTSHQVTIKNKDNMVADVALKDGKGYEGDRDYILKYQLAGDQINSGLLLFEGEEENFFLMMMQPPKRVAPEQIPPREYIFIVDVSGSMSGFPLDISKKLMRELISELRPIDKFNVILFAGSSSMYSSESVPGTSRNISGAINMIVNKRGGGGTEILPALQKALALPQQQGYSRTVVIATDGLVTMDKAAFELIRNNLGEANFFPFGIGTSTNRFIIDGIAHAGQGEALLATSKKEAIEAAAWFKKYIESPVLTNISTDFSRMNVYDVEPKSVPDIFAERPVLVFGKYKGKPKGNVSLNGISGNAEYTTNLSLSNFKPSMDNEALKYLWARKRIQILGDYKKIDRAENPALRKKIVDLGLKYNLLTDYTSFIAIDERVRGAKKGADSEQKSKKLSGEAIAMNTQQSGHNGINSMSGNSGAVPEPSEWALIIILFIFTIWIFRTQFRS